MKKVGDYVKFLYYNNVICGRVLEIKNVVGLTYYILTDGDRTYTVKEKEII